MEKKKVQKAELKFYLVTVFTCLMAMTLIVVIALFIYDSIRGRELEDAFATDGEYKYTQEQLDAFIAEAVEKATKEASIQAEDNLLAEVKEYFTYNNSTLAVIRPLFPGDIVLAGTNGYRFIPINYNLEMNNLVQENVVTLPSGELQYIEEGEVVSKKGIDVSKYQAQIDWEKVKADGVDYAIIRLGFRGYGSGQIVLDETYEKHIEGALAAGVDVGVYFFTQAITIEEAIEEAEYVLEHIAPYTVNYPIVIDVEKVADNSGRMNLIGVEDRTNIVKAFCDRIEEAGYESMIYGNMEMFATMLNYEVLEGYDKWYAFYSDQLYFPYEYKMWQYTENGKVDGIEGDVDLNISFKDW